MDLRQKIKWNARKCLSHLGLWSWFETQRMARHHIQKAVHEDEFLFLKRFQNQPLKIIDIGANAGQSALSMRAVHPTCEILSLEPNTHMQPFLEHVKKMLGSGFRYRLIGCGRQATQLRFYVPFVDGVALTQEGTFRKEILEHDRVTRERILHATGSYPNDIREETFEIVTLDVLADEADFIKIDVQGFEHDVILGGLARLKSRAPILFIENGIHLPPVIETLKGLGYQAYVYEAQSDTLSPYESSHTDVLNLIFMRSTPTKM